MAMPSHRRSLDYIVSRVALPSSVGSYRQIVHIRQWINGNSIHLVDAEHDSYAFHVPTVMDKLRQFNQEGGSPPHLSCGPRAYAMKAILDRLDVESRIIDLFVVRQGDVASHTLIEVYDKDGGQWVLQDPDFNVSYVHADTRLPLSVEDALRLGRRYIAYDSGGGSVENPANLDGAIENYFELGALYRHSYAGGRSLFLYLPTFDIEATPVRLREGVASFRRFLEVGSSSPEFRALGK